MKTANKVKHATKTRTQQRKLATFLKAKGLKATCERVKSSLGWNVNVAQLQRKKPLTSQCVNSNGSTVSVLTK